MKGGESVITVDQFFYVHWKFLGKSHELNIYLINCLSILQPIPRIKLIYFRIQGRCGDLINSKCLKQNKPVFCS